DVHRLALRPIAVRIDDDDLWRHTRCCERVGQGAADAAGADDDNLPGEVASRHCGNAPMPIAASVLAIEAFASDSACVKARIASIVSGTTIAWLSTMYA